jgi:hypothetical protein
MSRPKLTWSPASENTERFSGEPGRESGHLHAGCRLSGLRHPQAYSEGRASPRFDIV